MFLCRVPAVTGGETPLADTRRIHVRLPPDLVARFRMHGVMYRRCLDGRLGLSWQEVLGTADRTEAERRCVARGLRFSWRADGALRTEAMRKLVDRHPRTGNHVLFFPSALAPEARAALAGIPSEDLPNDRRFGDGSAVPDEAVAALRDA
jgi:hypothetical protein